MVSLSNHERPFDRLRANGFPAGSHILDRPRSLHCTPALNARTSTRGHAHVHPSVAHRPSAHHGGALRLAGRVFGRRWSQLYGADHQRGDPGRERRLCGHSGCRHAVWASAGGLSDRLAHGRRRPSPGARARLFHGCGRRGGGSRCHHGRVIRRTGGGSGGLWHVSGRQRPVALRRRRGASGAAPGADHRPHRLRRHHRGRWRPADRRRVDGACREGRYRAVRRALACRSRPDRRGRDLDPDIRATRSTRHGRRVAVAGRHAWRRP